MFAYGLITVVMIGVGEYEGTKLGARVRMIHLEVINRSLKSRRFLVFTCQQQVCVQSLRVCKVIRPSKFGVDIENISKLASESRFAEST